MKTTLLSLLVLGALSFQAAHALPLLRSFDCTGEGKQAALFVDVKNSVEVRFSVSKDGMMYYPADEKGFDINPQNNQEIEYENGRIKRITKKGNIYFSKVDPFAQGGWDADVVTLSLTFNADDSAKLQLLSARTNIQASLDSCRTNP